MSGQVGVTGRDDYIIVKALCYAIVVIESLPARRQEASDLEDMKQVLCHWYPDEKGREMKLEAARGHARIRPM